MNIEVAIKSSNFITQLQKSGINILYTAWWLKSILLKPLKENGLTHEQYNVLRILNGKHPEMMCVRDIASRMIEKSSNVPRIIDRLEAKKLVERSDSIIDKRETVMTLTKEGIDILNVATISVNEVFSKIVDINEVEAGMLNDLLEKYRKNE